MTRILLVDNYDSFTYNLHHQLARVSGSVPLVVRNDAVDLAGVRRFDPDVIVLSPGPGNPAVATDLGVCAPILTELRLPVLGVCLGFQALVRAAGGEVLPTTPMHGRTSEIWHRGTDLFAGLPARFSAVRYHSLAAADTLPDTIELTAWSPDGRPMAVRHRERPAWGVQFHPESICTEAGDALIANFFRLASAGRPPRPVSPGWQRPADRPAPPPARMHLLRRRLRTTVGAETAFVGLYAASPDAFWLDSSLTGPGVARWSFVGSAGAAGTTIGYDLAARQVTVRRGRTVERYEDDVLSVLERELDRVRVPVPESGPPFVGGFVGYLGYEVAADCDGRPAAPVAKRAVHPGPAPDAYWLFADRVLAFDHETGEVWATALAADGEQAGALRWFAEVERDLLRLDPPPTPYRPGGTDDDPLTVRLDRSPEQYLADIAACQEAILAGDSYELCLTTQAELDPVEAPLDLYRVLREVSPAPYAAYLRLGDVAVLSSSPERFLSLDAERLVTSKPMKGTVRRYADPRADAASSDALRLGVKDRAENLMIVDLLRNDLGRVCELDSVTVPGLMQVETYATVHQLVSTVAGRLETGRGMVDCLRACFPGGSMTGAPKLRSMEILDRLEPQPRGVYSGTLGYLSADGRAELNIVIRTAVATPDAVTVGVGGAITALSDPAAEFDEIVLKAQGIVRAVLAWQGRTFGPGAFRVVGPRLDQRV